ncbi:MAG: VOC family protein, partial [Pseudomonadota bacterium]|nr:VOC family protein [Pseudomonadota bacterium]
MTGHVDHLVWYAPDLAAGNRYFAQRMDRAPAYGGVHPGQGTANSLLGLGEATYLEILTRDPAQDAAGWLDPELVAMAGQGLYHWAVAGVDLDDIIVRARRAGIETSQVVMGGRRKPDGGKLAWRLVGLRNHAFGALLPFFIDWGVSEHPAASAPRGGSLLAVELHSPAAGGLSKLFETLGLAFTVHESRAPALVATLQG